MFQPVDGNVNFPEQELAVGKFWKAERIYEKSLAQRQGAPPFVFYEGPPTANGMPHPGHCLTRAIKDLFPRYQTMRGRLCERKAGWDTHGLPVEVEVCKELGIHSKEEIEAYGIEKFIHLCQKSVWRYMQEWRRLTERLGFWVDLDDAYVTYHQSYVESVWWSLKNLFDRGLLYQGHKIVWWWAQGGTALSAGEVGQGYRQVADPSVYVKFPLLDDAGNVTDTSLLVWTTTPWTLPANQFAAINPSIEYAVVNDPGDGRKLLVASELVESIAQKTKKELFVSASFKGAELIGRRFVPPFDFYYRQNGNAKGNLATEMESGSVDQVTRKGLRNLYYREQGIDDERIERLLAKQEEYLGWRVVGANFVSTDSGTGIVHIAPAFGEDDHNVFVKESLCFTRGGLSDFPCPVLANGDFIAGFGALSGRWVKDCDKDIIRDLKQRGLLFHQEQYVHDYPFCWRAEEDPLIQYPRESWFVKTTQFKGAMLANNAKINWLPEHIKDGRFGNFLESNVDWALSRERYWGTPLPIWKCENRSTVAFSDRDSDHALEAVGSLEELLVKPGIQGLEVWKEAKKLNPELPDDLKVHKPYIDAITYDSPCCPGARMQRVPEVIDCWYDSGAMPFAQWGFRGEPPLPGPPRRGEGGREPQRFYQQFPADFISEAIDQTRGWFYSLLAISTLIWGKNDEARMTNDEKKNSSSDIHHSSFPFPHPYRNCIVLGLMLGEDGQKMSKSKRNYLPPNEIFDRYGADALRWYFFANQPPWTSIRYSEQAIKDSIPEFLLRLWNVYSFFVIYANIDGFDPATELAERREQRAGNKNPDVASLTARVFASANSYRPIRERSELDRWILSELNRMASAVVERMDAYDNFAACGHITEFVDALSNWYVRRSRDRFWAADKRSVEKLDAYWTLYECLVTTAKVIAPFVPFLAETLWQNLAGVFQQGAESREPGAKPGTALPAPGTVQPAESVHLCDYPSGDRAMVDEALSARMNMVREISSLGRNARSAASLKVRQPLSKVEVVLADTTHQKWLEEHADLIAEELNVKAVEFTTEGEQYISYSVSPNFKRLGPRLGKNMPAAKRLLGEVDAGKMLNELKSTGKYALRFPDGSSVELDSDDIEVRLQAKPGWAAAQGKGSVVVLATELTPALIAEGLARDVVRLVQERRKELGLQFTDRINVGITTDSELIRRAVKEWTEYIKKEVLSVQLGCEANDVPIELQSLPGAVPHRAKIGEDFVTLYVQVAP